MIDFYRIEHPSGKFLYVNNESFVNHADLNSHNYDEKHIGIYEAIRNTYHEPVYHNTLDVTWNNINRATILDIQGHFYTTITEYMKTETFRCFFNNLNAVRTWFTQSQIKAIRDGGYQLFKYSFEVDFDPRKIYICDMQSAIDIEYMQRDSTIKELIDWDLIIDKSLSEKFCDHIRSMTDEEIYARAQTAPDCGFDVDSFLRNREIIGLN